MESHKDFNKKKGENSEVYSLIKSSVLGKRKRLENKFKNSLYYANSYNI
jgi:hypothetical protein